MRQHEVGALVNGDTVLQSAVLEGLAEAANYRRWLADLAAPLLGDNPIDIGSGTGDYAMEWAHDGQRLTLTEADPYRLGQLRERFAGHIGLSVRELSLPTTAVGDYSAVVAFNVLEHIDDDVAALRSCHGLLRPGGLAVLIVPAFSFAMSAFDREIGHVRRYRIGMLRERIEAAGLRVEEIRYINPVGLLAWVVGMRMLRRRPSPGAVLRTWDRVVVPALRKAETGRRPPFGQSVFAVARRS